VSTLTTGSGTDSSGAPVSEAATRRRGSLFASEARRLAARRLVWLLLLIAAAVYVLGVVLTAINTGKPSAGALEEARARQAADQQSYQENRERCLSDPGIPESEKEFACGSAELPLENYLSSQPFVLAEDLRTGATVVGAGMAALLFLVGATAIGAEWSSRSIVALLFWEPRRLKVMAVKLTVAALAAAVIAALAQALWLGTARVLTSTNGEVGQLEPDFWRETLALQGRLVVLAVLVALLGFGIANLLRNTAASLGAGFVYFAIIENLVRGVRPRWTKWLFTENYGGLVSPGGVHYTGYDSTGEFPST
jgi:hypothetical protein